MFRFRLIALMLALALPLSGCLEWEPEEESPEADQPPSWTPPPIQTPGDDPEDEDRPLTDLGPNLPKLFIPDYDQDDALALRAEHVRPLVADLRLVLLDIQHNLLKQTGGIDRDYLEDTGLATGEVETSFFCSSGTGKQVASYSSQRLGDVEEGSRPRLLGSGDAVIAQWNACRQPGQLVHGEERIFVSDGWHSASLRWQVQSPIDTRDRPWAATTHIERSFINRLERVAQTKISDDWYDYMDGELSLSYVPGLTQLESGDYRRISTTTAGISGFFKQPLHYNVRDMLLHADADGMAGAFGLGLGGVLGYMAVSLWDVKGTEAGSIELYGANNTRLRVRLNPDGYEYWLDDNGDGTDDRYESVLVVDVWRQPGQ